MTAPVAVPEPVVEKTREELLAARAKRQKAEAERVARAEFRELQLEDQYSANGQVRGRDFEIIECGLTEPIVVKRGAGVIFTKWSSEPDSVESTTEFIEASLVHPAAAEFHAAAVQFPPIRERVALAIATLYKAKIRGDAGKF